MSELWQLGATQLAAMIRSGDTSSREVTEANPARIDAVTPAGISDGLPSTCR